MKVRLLTAVASAEGSWGTGIRDLPDKLAKELIAGGLALLPDDARKSTTERPAAPKE